MEPTIFQFRTDPSKKDRIATETERGEPVIIVANSADHSSSDSDLVRATGERAADLLRQSPRLSAVLVEREWHVLHVAFGFEFLPVLEGVAARAGYFIQSIARPEAGGLEHLIFMTRANGLTYADLIQCIDEGAPTTIPNH